jgi:hypothetical protein
VVSVVMWLLGARDVQIYRAGRVGEVQKILSSAYRPVNEARAVTASQEFMERGKGSKLSGRL